MTAAPQEAAPKSRRLTDIVAEMLAMIDDAGGEVTARVDELGLELEDKVSAYGAVMKQLEAEEAAFEDLAHAYKMKAASRSDQVTALKFRLDAAMQAAGVDKLKTPTCTAYYQSSKSVAIDNEERFLDTAPDRFVTVKQYVNKTAVREALEAGEAVQGAELKSSKHLRVR